jgi:tRNA(Ile)-lysidine synthetase-like protein
MDIETKVKQTLLKMKLNKKDKILVALSGGKDSSVCAYLMKRLGYNLEGIHINLGMGQHSKDSQKAIEELCEKLKINLHIFYPEKEIGKKILKIFEENKDKKINTCVMCGVVKKWILNKKARELKAKYIATGHHRNDLLETFLMNIFKGSPELNRGFSIMLKLKEKMIVRIKPLFFVDEEEIEKYAKQKKLNVIREICPYRGETYRVEVREFVRTLSKKQKENLMKNAIELNKKLKINETKINYCEKCGEPCRGKICKMCQLIRIKK